MGVNKVVFDSSVLVAYFNPNDTQTEKAVSLIKKLKKENKKFVLHPLIVIETLSVLKLKVEKEALLICQEILFNPEIFEIENININLVPNDFSFLLFNKIRTLSLIDAVIIDYCLGNNFELLTFDKTMGKEYQKLIKPFNKID